MLKPTRFKCKMVVILFLFIILSLLNNFCNSQQVLRSPNSSPKSTIYDIKFSKTKSANEIIVIISGKNFRSQQFSISVNSINLEVQSFSSTEVKAVMSSTTLTTMNKLYFDLKSGTSSVKKWYLKGIKGTIYSTSLCTDCRSTDRALAYIANHKTIIKSEVFFQLYENFKDDCFFEIFEGKFTALFAGEYRFWGNSDDGCRVMLDRNQVYDFPFWNIEDSFYVLDQNGVTADNLKGPWISLEKDKVYDFKAYFLEMGGNSHMKLGVEIRNYKSDPDPNKISLTNIFPVEIRPIYTRHLIKIDFGLNQTIDFFNDKGVKLFSINANDSKESIFDNFKRIFKSVIVVKFEKNLIGKIVIYNDSYWNYNSVSYNSFIQFSAINDEAIIKSKINWSRDMWILSGSAVFVCFDFNVYKIPKFNDYMIKSGDIPKLFSSLTVIPQNLNPSTYANAVFSITFNNYHFNNLKYTYDDTVESNYPKSADGKVRLIRERGLEGIRFNILAFDLDVKISPTIDISCRSLTLNQHYTVLKLPKSVFIYPLPSDFFTIEYSKPQITVRSDGYQSLCPIDTCSWEYFPSMTLTISPLVIPLTTQTTVTLTNSNPEIRFPATGITLTIFGIIHDIESITNTQIKFKTKVFGDPNTEITSTEPLVISYGKFIYNTHKPIYKDLVYSTTSKNICHFSCVNCGENSPFICDTCIPNYYKLSDKTGVCRLPSGTSYIDPSDRKPYYLSRSESLLRPCYANCSSCLIAGTDLKNNCKTCKTTFYPTQENLGNCIAANTPKYFLSRSLMVKCGDTNCLRCNSLKNCLKCNPNYFKFKDVLTNFYNCKLGEIVGYFKNTSTTTYERCKVPNCAVCPNDGINCTSCQSTFYPVIDSSNSVDTIIGCAKPDALFSKSFFDSTNLKKAYYLDSSNQDEPVFRDCGIHNCKFCQKESQSICLLCQDAFYLDQNSCISNLIGHFRDTLNEFKPCGPNCDYCTSADFCLKCTTDYLIFPTAFNSETNSVTKNSCENTIKSKYYKNNFLGTYELCHLSCIDCKEFDPLACTSCQIGYYNIEADTSGKCYIQSYSTIIVSESNDFVKMQNYFLNNSPNAPNGMLLSPCDDSCSTCEGAANKCLTCAEGHNQLEESPQTCVKPDPLNLTRYFDKNSKKVYFLDVLNDNVFKLCHESCKSCNKQADIKGSNCNECQENHYKKFDNELDCFMTPLNFYYLNALLNRIFPCPDNCVICTDSLRCTQCESNYYFFKESLTPVIDGFALNTDSEDNTNNSNDNYSIKCKKDPIEGYYLDTLETKSYIKCRASCKNCLGAPENCIGECNSGFIKMQTDDYFNKKLIIDSTITSRCFADSSSFYYEEFNLHFYKDDKENIFKKCDTACTKCSLSADNCLSCAEGFFNLEDDLSACRKPAQNNVFWDDSGKKAYFLEEDGEMKLLRLCAKNCKSCAAAASELTQNCLECVDGFYFLPQMLNTNCYPKPEEYYYVDELSNKLIACSDNCRKCDKNGCVECEKLFYKLSEKNRKITCKEGNMLGYFIDLVAGEYRLCDAKCRSCEERENLCGECDNSKGFYLLEEKYSLNITKFDAEECHKDCPTNYRLHTSNQYCEKFLNLSDLSLHDNGTANYTFDEIMKEINGKNESTVINTEKAEELNKLVSDSNVKLKKDLIEKLFNSTNNSINELLKPEHTPKVEDVKLLFLGMNLLMKDIPDPSKSTLSFNNNHNSIFNSSESQISEKEKEKLKRQIEEMKSKAEAFGASLIQTLSSNTNGTKSFDTEILMQSKAFTMKIVPIARPKNKKNKIKRIRILETQDSNDSSTLSDSLKEEAEAEKNLAKINFENCKKVLMHAYNISNEEAIVMRQMDYNAQTNLERLSDPTQSNSTSFVFFDVEKNQKLNTSFCKGTAVPISISIPNPQRLNMQLYMLSAKLLEGTDVYNKQSPSFHSRCYKSFDFNTDADISINSRRTKLFQNDTMNCSPGCEYKGIDEDRKVICDCTELGEGELSNNSISEALLKLPAMNFDISLCFNQVFLNENIFKNVCLYIVFSFILVSILSYVFFRRLSFKLVKYKIEAVIRTDIQIFNEEKSSKDKYFNSNNALRMDKKIDNEKVMDFLIGKKPFNKHLGILEDDIVERMNQPCWNSKIRNRKRVNTNDIDGGNEEKNDSIVIKINYLNNEKLNNTNELLIRNQNFRVGYQKNEISGYSLNCGLSKQAKFDKFTLKQPKPNLLCAPTNQQDYIESAANNKNHKFLEANKHLEVKDYCKNIINSLPYATNAHFNLKEVEISPKDNHQKSNLDNKSNEFKTKENANQIRKLIDVSKKNFLNFHYFKSLSHKNYLNAKNENNKKFKLVLSESPRFDRLCKIKTFKDYETLKPFEAIKFDKRPFDCIFWEFLVKENPILNLIFYESVLEPLWIRCINFYFSLSLLFFMNALFFTDNEIDKRSDQPKDVRDSIFFTFVEDSIKTCYSLLFCFILGYLFEIIVRIPQEIEEEFAEDFLKSDYKGRLKKIKKFEKQMSWRYSVFLATAFLLNLFIWYYTIIFCDIFSNSNFGYINGIIVSFFIDVFAICILLPLIKTVIRMLIRYYPALRFLIVIEYLFFILNFVL